MSNRPSTQHNDKDTPQHNVVPPLSTSETPAPSFLGEGDEEKIIEPALHKKTRKLVLYKYISCVALKDLLLYGDLKISYRHDANDPLEMLPAGHLPYENRDSETGFMSFTQNANDPAMWGNYAGKYTGARIRLEIPCFSDDMEHIAEGFKQTKHLNLEQMLGCYLSALCGPALAAGIETSCYRISCRGGSVEHIGMIFKCVYQNNRHCFKSRKEIAKESKIYSDKPDNGTILSALTIMENSLQVAVKHTTWSQENEFRSLVPINLITRKLIQEHNIFLTNHFTKYITTITLAPMCPITMMEAQILMQGDASSNHHQTVQLNRANFNKKSFLLDIPGEYQDGKLLNS